MVEEVVSYVEETQHKRLTTRGEILRAVFEGLACSYREAFDDLREITGKTYSCINIVGGGSRNYLIDQYTANICNVTVIAGPAEATTIGNVLSQLEYHGKIHNEEEKSQLIYNSFQIEEFLPNDKEIWEACYRNYRRLRDA